MESSQEVGWRTFLGIGVLGLFALSAELSTAGANIALGLLVLLLVATPSRSWQELRQDPLFYLSLVYLAYLFVRWAIAAWEWPAQADQQADAAKGWALSGFLLVVVVGAWVSRLGNPNRGIRVLLGLLLVGFLTSTWAGLSFSQIQDVLNGQRYTFNFAGTEAGLYFGVGFLGLLLFGPRIWRICPCSLRLLVLTGWLVLAAAVLVAFVGVQSRGAWLAFALVAPTCFIALFSLQRKSGQSVISDSGKVVSVAVVLLVIGIGAWQWNTLSSRVVAQQKAVSQVFSDGLDNASVNSITKRLFMWRWGLERFAERPILGWGPRNLHFEAKDDPVIEKVPRLTHLHNTFLDILVRFGMVGFVLFGLQWVLIFQGLYRGLQKKILALDLGVFLGGAWGMWFVWSFFAVRLNHPEMSFFVAMIGGAAYGAGMRHLGGVQRRGAR